MIRFLLKLAVSKPVTTAYPAEAIPPERGLRGTPTLVPDLCKLTGACQAVCPTGAIKVAKDRTGTGSWQIDYGNCIFCGACVLACPEGAILPSDAFELAVRQRGDAIVTHELRSLHD
jgi:formate hydrogenlyase subunit 6/NADH:ubiquinone oxidoreductase subunit I